MKKGSTLPPGAVSPAKRKRTGSAQEPTQVGAFKANFNSLARFSQADKLGSASKDWELPDIGSTSINAAESWETAIAAADARREKNKPKHHQQQKKKIPMPPAAPINTSNQQDFAPRFASVQAVPMDGGAAVVGTTSIHGSKNTAGSGMTLQRGYQLQPMNSGAPQMNRGMDGGATVVSNSTGSGSHYSMPSMSSGGMHMNTDAATVVTNSTGSGSHYSAASTGVSTVTFDTARGPPMMTPNAVPMAAAPVPTPAAPPVVPKATLYQFYGKKPRRKQLSNEDYYSWNNGGKPHELKFTAIFQCPITGECFPSGRYGDSRCYEVHMVRNNDGQEVQIVWYTKKTLAEHGAAARCYDCILYREALLQGAHAVQALKLIGTDPAYTRANAPAMPPVPVVIGEKITKNQKRIQEFMGAAP